MPSAPPAAALEDRGPLPPGKHGFLSTLIAVPGVARLLGQVRRVRSGLVTLVGGGGARARPFGIMISLDLAGADEECRNETDDRGGDGRDRHAGDERGPG